MPLFLPEKLVVNSPLTSAQFISKVKSSFAVRNEKGLFKLNRFIKTNNDSLTYYGSSRENAFTVFCHLPKKHDGGGVRFNGVAVDKQNGCVIAGYLRHGLAAYLFGLVWDLILLMAAVVFLVDQPEIFLLPVILIIAGNALLFSGRKNAVQLEKFIKELAETDKLDRSDNSDKF